MLAVLSEKLRSLLNPAVFHYTVRDPNALIDLQAKVATREWSVSPENRHISDGVDFAIQWGAEIERNLTKSNPLTLELLEKTRDVVNDRIGSKNY